MASTPANGGSNGAVRTTVATLHVPEPWVVKDTGNQLLPPTQKTKGLVQRAVLWEGIERAIQWLVLGHFALLLWGFGDLMTQQILWLCWGVLAQAAISKLVQKQVAGVYADVPCCKASFQPPLKRALGLYWSASNVGALLLACKTAALWFFYFYQRAQRRQRYFDLGAFPEEGAHRFDELLLAGCCLASLWAVSLLWLVVTRFFIVSVSNRGKKPASQAVTGKPPVSWHCWYIHINRHAHLLLDGAQGPPQSCGLPAYWFNGDIRAAALERSMSQEGGASFRRESTMGALAILANSGPEGRKQVLEENGFQVLVDNLANGSNGVQVQAAAAIGSLSSDALTMKYGPADLVSCIPALRELARTGSTPDAKEKASGALLNVARSGGAEVQKAIYSEDKLTNQKGLDLLLELAQNGPTAACKVRGVCLGTC
jgi:hypothetical protein